MLRKKKSSNISKLSLIEKIINNKSWSLQLLSQTPCISTYVLVSVSQCWLNYLNLFKLSFITWRNHLGGLLPLSATLCLVPVTSSFCTMLSRPRMLSASKSCCWISLPFLALSDPWLVQFSCSGSNLSPSWLIQSGFSWLLPILWLILSCLCVACSLSASCLCTTAPVKLCPLSILSLK